MDRSIPQSAAERRARIAVVALAAFPFVAFLAAAAARAGYPWDLEWIEGECRDMARRFAAGQPMYGPPTIEHISLPYFPLYFVVIGWIYRATGVVYWAGRLVSAAAATATGGLIFWIVRRGTKQTAAAAVGAGLWFAAYGFSGFFYDLDRVDSLAIFFLAASYAAAFDRAGAAAGLAAGTLLAISALTKQNHLVFCGPIVATQLVRGDWRGAAAFAGSFLTVFGGTTWLWNWNSDGWFWKASFQFVTFGCTPSRGFEFAATYLRCFPAPAAMLVWQTARLARRRDWRGLLGDPWLVFWAASVAVSSAMILGRFAYANAAMPAALGTALAAGRQWPEFLRRLDEGAARAPAAARRWLPAALTAVAIFTAYAPVRPQVPSRAQWAAAAKLHELIRAEPGPVLVPEFLLAEPNVVKLHEMTYVDLRTEAAGTWRGPWLRLLEDDLRNLRPTLVLAGGDLRRNKQFASVVAGMSHARLPRELRVRTVTGRGTMLAHIFRREPDLADAAAEIPTVGR